MTFGIHCDTSLAIADALSFQKAVTIIRMSDGTKVKPYTVNYRPAMAACRSWLA